MKKLIENLFGRKYYVVIARDRFRLTEFCVGHIFGTYRDAFDFMTNLAWETKSNAGLEVHSFRSFKDITVYEFPDY